MSDQSRPTNPANGVEVLIGARRYWLRGDDPELLRALAARVDETLGRVAGPGGARDDFKTAVLAALNLAVDHEERRSYWLERARAVAQQAREVRATLARLSAPPGPSTP